MSWHNPQIGTKRKTEYFSNCYYLSLTLVYFCIPNKEVEMTAEIVQISSVISLRKLFQVVALFVFCVDAQ